MTKISKINFILFLFTLIILSIFCLLIDNFYFGIAFSLWIILFIYSLLDISNRSLLFGFCITFFIFLLGREFVQVVLSFQVENFPERINNHAYILYILSLFTFLLSYPIFSRNKKLSKLNNNFNKSNKRNVKKITIIRNISKFYFFVTLFFAIFSKISAARFVLSNSYFEYYTEYLNLYSENIIMSVFSFVERMMPVALSVFLAASPTKKETKYPLVSYIIYLIISLATGARSTFMLGILFIFIYFIFRNNIDEDDKWLNKKSILIFIILIPITIFLATTISFLREGNDISNLGFLDAIYKFVYDQGVTSNIIKRSFAFKELLNSNKLYTLEFLRSGIFARILGIDVYYGNTYEHAMYGGSFAHSIGFILLGDNYLSGRGTGSSYIAEFYQDFGYFGAIIGSIFYSYLISKVELSNRSNENIFKKSIFLFLVQRILWAPRGSFSDIISSVFSYPTLLIIITIYLSYKFYNDLIISRNIFKEFEYD
ncbi:O-antigen polysaccharide polymerase Wzy family protein [Facklamia sp. P12955]|uniref:O-antigen polysaccharide polymerase Wzy family protein n=1 Tax=Facklamia sp. P12955 TaxID=3421946 RepID=UPI003D17CDDF